ncbi:CRISPR-associated protein Csm5 [Cruoricaptor ignavus]|uniref:CRISPR system Cms protein Csm5 n=1 Tax=Cruoricaptor ignavus TaxID=1118202 RepID=A0A1M6DK58_9FLAO|nr:type III-A CRISPR-associated RAMP protein Csm5 [Cruoricaptor ignavus]SHI73513.1 CRISPR-associated protein Csm5 [Cruoricaptor ignavus]
MPNPYNIKLTTLSPVCIGSGEKLSPYADFIIDQANEGIHYINKAAVEKILGEYPELMDDYVSGITSGNQNFSLKSFLEEELNLDEEEYILKSYQCSGTEIKELNTIVKNAGQKPYIPGSTIKGAIKTALLYDWTKSNEGMRWANDYLNSLENDFVRKNLEKKLDSELAKIELQISDTDEFGYDALSIVNVNKIKITTGVDRVKTLWEAVLENKSTHFTANFGNQNWEQIFPKINLYSKECNEMEMFLLDNAGQTFSQDYKVDYDDLLQFYREKSNQIDRANRENAACLRIGNGKGFYYNTVALALYNADNSNNKQNFTKFLRNNGFKNPPLIDAKKFPLTRAIELGEFLPVGWVKLELEN